MACIQLGLIMLPIIIFSNSGGEFKFSSGSMYPITRPYCPCPPDCFLCW